MARAGKLFALLAILACLGLAKAEDRIANVHFQVTGVPDTTSMLKYRGSIPDLQAYSVCVRIRLHRHRLWSSILSYGKDDIATGYKDQLVLGLTESSNEIWSMGNQLQGLVNEAVQLYRWRHTCYLVNLQTLRWRVFVNDKSWEGYFQTQLESAVLPGGGSLVLGQEQGDEAHGGYSKRKSFNGELNDFYMYDYLMTDEEVQTFLRCNPLHGKFLVHFRTINETFDILGNTKVGHVSRESLCHNSADYKYDDAVFPEVRPYAATQNHCRKFRAHITLPLNAEDNESVFGKLQPYNQECFHDSGFIVWINAHFSVDAGRWLYNTTGKKLSYTNFAAGYGSGSNSRTCAAIFHVHPFVSLWGHHTCGQKFCGMCRLERFLKYRIRGLCSSSKFDSYFFATGYRNKKIQFMGFYASTIYWNNSTWVLASMDGTLNDLRGEMVMAFVDEYPLGRHAWKVSGDSCGQVGIEKNIDLLMTTCPESGFTCDSGHCLNSTQRCDQHPDCQDESDEHNCSLIDFPQGYNRDLQPSQTSKGKAIVIWITISVKGIRKVDLIDESFYVNLQEKLEWYDYRLEYKNLKKESFLNVIPKTMEDLIWLPDIQKQDGNQQEADVTPRGRSVMVVRKSPPNADNPVQAREDQYFDGARNSLVMTLETSTVFTCVYDFVDYPFDLQICTMIFKLGSVTSSHAVLKLKEGEHGGIVYKGPQRLLEYEVVDLKAINSSVGQHSSVQVTLILRNLHQYYISSTFIPTTLLIIITQLTLRYRLDDFQNRIMVSLTVLLVLSSLFSQVSASIPKTSYVKLIDLWFLLAIVYVFITLLFLLLIEHRRNLALLHEGNETQTSNRIKVAPIQDCSKSRGNSQAQARRLNERCKAFLAVLWVFLLVIYIVLASVGVRVFVG